MNCLPRRGNVVLFQSVRFASGAAQPKPFSEIPGPKPIPILGNTWRYFKKPLSAGDFAGWHEILRKEYGDICIVRKQMSVPDTVFIYNPTDIEILVRNEGKYPKRFEFRSLTHYKCDLRGDFYGDTPGIGTSEGEAWYKLRSSINPVFLRPNVFNTYIPELNKVSADFLKRMRKYAKANPEGEMPKNFIDDVFKWAFESVGTIALDRRLGCLDENPSEEVEKMVKYMLEIFRLIFVLDFMPFGRYIIKYNLPLWKRFVEYNDYFINLSLRYTNEVEEKLKTQKKEDHEKSVFEKLLEIDKKVATISTLDMLSAGIDTTGLTTSSMLYLLAKHEDAQNKLREELMRLMPTPDSPVTKEVLSNAPYLKAVVKETGRFAPISLAHMRITDKELILAGYRIPSGVMVMIPTMYLSKSEEHYKRAKEFIPDRWLKTTTGEMSYKSAKPFVTLPFGFGSRVCVGQRFAQLEMEVLIAKIIRNFKLSWPHPDMRFKQELLYGIKDPLRIRIKDVEK